MLSVCPSTLAHIINGILILVAVIMILFNWRLMRSEMRVLTILILATAIGVHGISHRWLEQSFKIQYEPYSTSR